MLYILPVKCCRSAAKYRRQNIIEFLSRQVCLSLHLLKVPSIIHPWYSSCCRINPMYKGRTKHHRQQTPVLQRNDDRFTGILCFSSLLLPRPFCPRHSLTSLRLRGRCPIPCGIPCRSFSSSARSAPYAARLVPAPAENILVHLNGQLFQMQTVYFLFSHTDVHPVTRGEAVSAPANTCSPSRNLHILHICSFRCSR